CLLCLGPHLGAHLLELVSGLLHLLLEVVRGLAELVRRVRLLALLRLSVRIVSGHLQFLVHLTLWKTRLRSSGSDVRESASSYVISFAWYSSNSAWFMVFMPDLPPVCMIEVIWCALSSRMSDLIAEFARRTSAAMTRPRPSAFGRSCWQKIA